ncbi:MAG: TIGR00282 family metallophosphoesterase [Alphaproteobacteria bacterium CG_4_10_14_0_8_um_filter_53_9]|nr:MAG: TIGR00282 family metallophosphoesterase [Alphaproteobacteria bacterium CG_4_10_14_0_8_um_filter_53_9]
MKILFLGDVFAAPGRAALKKYLPLLKAEHQPDVVIVNGENSAHGRGISDETAAAIFAAGADIITLGDHTFDQKGSDALLANNPKIIRPANFAAGTPGRGHTVFTTASGKKIMVMQLLGRVFMKTASVTDCPFRTFNALTEDMKLGKDVDAIFVDFHAEATSEKACFFGHADGKASAVVGTHTHIPTNDARIFPKGTAVQTDAGMCGDYESSIGLSLESVVPSYLSAGRHYFQPATGNATLGGVLIETDDKGKAIKIQSLMTPAFTKEK